MPNEAHRGLIQYESASRILQQAMRLGMHSVVISPGSRSTPLVLAADRLDGLQTLVSIDERSAAFLALGMARVHKQPVGLICTSGTAALHYAPAMVEAYLQGLSLFTFTADRPATLRAKGVNQTIDQRQLYGVYADFIDLDAQNGLIEDAMQALQQQMEQSVQMHKNLQVNVQFDKPLEPEQLPAVVPTHAYAESTPIQAPVNALDLSESFLNALKKAQRPLFLAGASNEAELYSPLYRKISEIGLPVLAECSSGYDSMTNGRNFFTATHFLQDKSIDPDFAPDLIISSGQTPTHKATLAWLKAHSKVPTIHFNGQLRDLQNAFDQVDVTHRGPIDSKQLDFIDAIRVDSTWLQRWQHAHHVWIEKQKRTFEAIEEDQALSQAAAIHFLTQKIPNNEPLFLSNSLLARDLDGYRAEASAHRVYSTRGASGIDGLLAQALGSSLSLGGRTHLLIGDVSLQHDSGSLELLARLGTRINLQIWVFNNGGGKIFDLLPIRQHENILEDYFHTTPAVDFGTLAKAYSISSFKISTLKDFKEALAQPRSVSTLFEIRC